MILFQFVHGKMITQTTLTPPQTRDWWRAQKSCHEDATWQNSCGSIDTPACRATVVILPMKLLGKPPLANKMQKNNAKTCVYTGRCRQFVNVLRILLYWCGITFYFFETYVLFIRPKCKIKCRNGGRRGGLWEKFFYLFASEASK